VESKGQAGNIDLVMVAQASLRARELAETLSWEKSRVSHQVTRMEKRQLVERRECDTDLRGSWVGLTADGKRAVLGTMREHSASIRRYFLDVLTPAEFELRHGAQSKEKCAVLSEG
jgi:DNA-binding MarR family transcriptional regulator